MQAFELYFAPKKKDELFLNSFIYEPDNIYEKKLGNLYIVGELTQAMPQNSHFLNNLSLVIKKEYYSSGLKKSCEASLQEALKKGNEFLEKESRKGNVGWLGNLNFAVLNFKNPILNFAQTGDMKIFLIRREELIDISQSLETELPHPNPLKMFGSMAAGKLSQDDKVIVLNKNLFASFNKNKAFLNQLCNVSEEKDLKQAIKAHKQSLLETSGICLYLMGAGEESSGKTVTLRQDLPRFSFYKTFLKPLVSFLSRIKRWRLLQLKIKLPFIGTPKIKIKKPHKAIKFPKPKIPRPRLPKIRFNINKKNLLLVLGLALILVSFSFIFGGEKELELKEAQQKLAEAQSKTTLAESFLVLKEQEKAEAIFQEVLEIISPLTKRGSPVRDEALSLQRFIEQHLLIENQGSR